ncbi:hypothetical protein FB451DRAFT_1169212 [Mycena latifolia]|nr:hypothetical protein FB451DRAFT_1169212 [Mycena latifolia]
MSLLDTPLSIGTENRPPAFVFYRDMLMVVNRGSVITRLLFPAQIRESTEDCVKLGRRAVGVGSGARWAHMAACKSASAGGGGGGRSALDRAHESVLGRCGSAPRRFHGCSGRLVSCFIATLRDSSGSTREHIWSTTPAAGGSGGGRSALDPARNGRTWRRARARRVALGRGAATAPKTSHRILSRGIGRFIANSAKPPERPSTRGANPIGMTPLISGVWWSYQDHNGCCWYKTPVSAPSRVASMDLMAAVIARLVPTYHSRYGYIST